MVQTVYVLLVSIESMDCAVNVQQELSTTKTPNFVFPSVKLMKYSVEFHVSVRQASS